MRGQLNIRVDDARKARWTENARARGLDLTAWIFLHLDNASRDEEDERLALFAKPPAAMSARGAYSD